MKVVLYHNNCQDGLLAAFTVWEKFGNDAVYIPVDYKPAQDLSTQEALNFIFTHKSAIYDSYNNSNFKISEITPDKYKDIDLIIVDYSFPVKQFKDHINMFKSITILDHHDSSIKQYLKEYKDDYKVNDKGWIVINPSNNSLIIFSEKQSGAKLTYMYYNVTDKVPGYIELINDRDLWQFNLKFTRSFHFGLKLINFTNFNDLDKSIKYGMSRIMDVGNLYEKDIMHRVNKLKGSGNINIIVMIDGKEYSCGIVNSYLDISSDLCSSIIKDGYDISIAYTIKHDNTVSCSVRSKEGVDSSVISKHFGGGGHKQASGYSFSLKQLYSILNKRIIRIKTKPNMWERIKMKLNILKGL